MGAKNPVLLIPGGLKEKTVREFSDLDRHWQRHPNLQIVSYQLLGRERGKELLFELNPDLIVCDEVHKLRNLRAGCTRRVGRYMDVFPETVFVGVSGTITSRSILDFQHLLMWALGPEQMPLPADRRIATQWSLALDVEVEDNQRLSLGALEVLVREGKPTREAARAALGDRIRSTPGVVSQLSVDDSDASIYLEYWDPEIPPEISELIKKLYGEEACDPNGDPIIDPLKSYQYLRQLVCGFFYKWLIPGPPHWMELRKGWKRQVRHILDDRIPGIDTETDVKRMCAVQNDEVLAAWLAVEKDFVPETVAVWEDLSVMEQLIDICEGSELIWVEHTEVGEKLSELTGFPYFHKKGLHKGVPVEAYAGKSVILSVESNKEGRNLQAWSRNIVVTPPSTGEVWEQLIGRTHRFGQMADEINVIVMLGHPNISNTMEKAFSDARYQQALNGSQHKLLLADTSRMYNAKKETK
jgi:hypothetical protein